MPTRDDKALLRRAIAVTARAKSNHFSGAILVGLDGEVLLEAESTVVTDRDAAGHPERNLMTPASRRFPRELLAHCTLYISTEPCVMCAEATYWIGVRRVVYGLAEKALLALTGAHPESPTFHLPCRTVSAAGQAPTKLIGPLLAAKARAVHEEFWE